VSVDELLADLDAHAVLADLHADTTTSAAVATAGGATGSAGGGDGDGEAGRSQASRLVALAQDAYDLVLGTDGRAYAVDHAGPRVAVPLRGRDSLRQRLARTYYAHTGTAPSASALADALTVVEGLTAALDPTPVALRVAKAEDGALVLDLGDPTGRVVVTHPGGWHLADTSPVLFRRTTLTSPLPTPTVAPATGEAPRDPGAVTPADAEPTASELPPAGQPTGTPAGGGRLGALRELLNVDDTGFALIVGWLLAALVPDIPHPILALLGEQGTAKSTAARFLVSLIDPSPAPLRSAPKDVRSWAVTAAASWTVALDNVSSVPQWFSDTLCKAVTGDGIVDRALFTDDDVTVLAFRRVITLTSIDAGALAGDLAERLVPVELHRIHPTHRRADEHIEAAYQTARPALLADLLDLLAAVQAALPGVHLVELPRMADFARLLAALDTVTGWHTLPAYTAAAAEATATVLDTHPVALAVRHLLTDQAVGWTGTAADLLALLAPGHGEAVPRGFPATPRGLAGQLRRVAPALRAAGIDVEFTRDGTAGGTRLIRLAHTTPDPPAPTETAGDRHDRHHRHDWPLTRADTHDGPPGQPS
jgi:hypothetical protein